jgi:hypothetical protein
MGKLNKLTALQVTKAKPGMHADGGGLYLRVGASGADGAKSWIFRYSIDSKEHYLGLGSADAVKLAQAREHAIGPVAMLRDKTFETHVARGPEQVWPDLAALEWCDGDAVWPSRQELREVLLAQVQRQGTQVVAAQRQDVEGI